MNQPKQPSTPVFKPVPRNFSNPAGQPGMQAEIELLRAILERMNGAARSGPARLEDWSGMLAALGSVSSRLAGLLKAQAGRGEGETRAALGRAVRAAIQEPGQSGTGSDER